MERRPSASTETSAAPPPAAADPVARLSAWQVVWRTLPVQAAFNPETLQGAGFAWAVLPALRRAESGRDREPGRRAAELAGGFNANPYLAPFAVAAVTAEEGRATPERVSRFLGLVRGPLGALGDALFWGAARPALFIPAALAVAAGAPWWLGLAALVPFNALAFAARFTGARVGRRDGFEMGAALGRSWIRRAPAPLRLTGAALTGLVAGWALAHPVGAIVATSALVERDALPPAANLAMFGVALVAFAFAPRRMGWGPLLLGLWALAATIGAWASRGAPTS